jgi:hypothetical protein
MVLGCQSYPDLGKGYRLHFHDGDMTILDSVNRVLVFGHVLESNSDSTFILALQKPRDSVPECRGVNGATYSDCRKAFRNCTIRMYWIIDKANGSIWGPFQKDSYLIKRKELGVSRSLRLKSE